jgi:AraC-like DNA-binding protein
MDRAPVRMSRVESATGWWEFARRSSPGPGLAGLVARRTGYREWAPGARRRRQPASSLIPVILSFGDRLQVLELTGGQGADRSYRSFLAGLHPGAGLTQFSGTQFGLQVDLTPLGAYQILGIPGAELAHRVSSLDDIAPVLTRSLPDRLASLPTWGERFAVLDDVLARLAGRRCEPDPLVRWMWDQLRASGGQARIADLVERTGWSHRHVTARFRREVGLTPKAAASIIRFERAAAAVSSTRMPLAEVAVRYGYADQSHLTHEFVRLAGQTPAAYARVSALDQAH